MKLLIIEGQDRCGKDSLINAISAEYPNIIKRHWSFPKGSTNEDKTTYQKDSFNWEFENYRVTKSRRYQQNNLMIWNRAHLGELVYGSLYRNSNPENWVMQLEEEYEFHKDPDVYLVYLYADPEFIVKKDDGESYSAKLDDKRAELEVFMKAFKDSKIIHKLAIKVNEGDSYVSKESIINQVKQLLNE
jgi:thymidylate kinase